MGKQKSEHGDDREYYFESYKDFAWRFRLWLVAYGIGLPAVIVSSKELWAVVKTSCDARFALWMPLVGVGIQVFVTWVFKTCMWYCDRHAKKVLPAESLRYRSALWITDRYYLEMILDFVTLGLYVYSTFILLKILLNS
jgi:hypothetical protein